MVKLGRPPGSLPAPTGPEILTLPPRRRLWRVYFRASSHPTVWNQFRTFGPTDARFDHHLPDGAGNPCDQSRAILYAAEDLVSAIAEVFQRSRSIHRARGEPWLVGFSLERPVVLLDLRSTWPTRAGASAAISTGARSYARQWATRIYETFPEIAGLAYASSMHALQAAVAFYERAMPSLAGRPFFHRAFSDPAWDTVLRNAAARIGYRII